MAITAEYKPTAAERDKALERYCTQLWKRIERACGPRNRRPPTGGAPVLGSVFAFAGGAMTEKLPANERADIAVRVLMEAWRDYGVHDGRTHVVRAYLNGPFRKSRTGDFIMRLYLRFGERVARVVKRSKLLKAVFRPFFDAALSRALEA